MKSLVLTADGLRLADTPMPPLMPGDIRIEVRSVGICGTDIAIWKGDWDIDLPLVLGHEITGIVHESSVPELRAGTLVTTEAVLRCGRCWYCKNGYQDHCKQRETIGLTVDGGLSEYLCVSADMVHALPQNVDRISGTFAEPLASALQTYNEVTPGKEENLVIIGSGKIGLLLAQVFDAFGAEVHLVGRNHWQLGLARQMGLRNTINMENNDWKSKVLSVTEGVGPRIVVEATGTSEGLTMAFEIVRDKGIIALKSMHGHSYPLKPTEIVVRELTIIGTSSGPFDAAIDMLDKGRIEVKKLVSAQFSLDDGAKAFEYAAKPNVTKVIVNV